MAKRHMYVPMSEILDAMGSQGDDGPQWYLDLETGEVALWIDPLISGEDPELDPDDPRYAAIPHPSAREDHDAMVGFVGTLDEESDVQETLGRALSGRGAFSRFRQELNRHPDLRARWEIANRDRLLTAALRWLDELGIEPQYELPPIVVAQPVGRPDAEPGQSRVGLLDLLLLGAPEGKSELVDGRVARVLRAASEEQARKVYARIARELTEHHGISWRRRFIEGEGASHYSVGRGHLSLAGRLVRLEVEVPQAIWETFSPP